MASLVNSRKHLKKLASVLHKLDQQKKKKERRRTTVDIIQVTKLDKDVTRKVQVSIYKPMQIFSTILSNQTQPRIKKIIPMSK